MEQKWAADSKTAEEILVFVRKYEEGFNKHNSAALAALCTDDAVQVSPEGPIRGRQAIEEKYADFFQQSQRTDLKCTVEQVYAVGNVSWNFGDWNCTFQGENGQISASGHRLDILVREGDAWKECMSCYDVAPTPGAPDTN